MKTPILLITLLFLIINTFGQNRILNEYDLSKGGYYLLGTFSESDQNSLKDSIGEFYTDDITLLDKFKNDWVFDKPEKMYACGYHYTIFVCRQGQILQSFSINLNCKTIVTDRSSFYFDPNLLRQFYGKLKKPLYQLHSFNSIAEARECQKTLFNDSTLIMTTKPLWESYEGSFRFNYKCKDDTKNCLDEDGKIFKSVEKEIAQRYPNEEFILENVGSAWTSIEFLLTCNSSLSDKFDLYFRDKETYFGKWAPFDLILTSYRTTTKQ